ncbi:hypothetical protein [Oscillatoria sp. FACHB-1407]|uniref:hypothetical protein n=1 Tax=Oscillatoria sp. FACHB-1407 TaxID=2692847 RepID=UPI00281658F0|nr:hypothetical protein [Oscillatoria sp. FACHB-1407]
MVAMVWLVYHLTQSPVLLGIVGFVSQVPNLVLVPFGGVLSDMSFLGMISFGNLFQGTLVSLLGAPTTVAVSGVVCVLVSIFYARQLPRLRRMVWASHPELAPPNLQP